MIPFLECCGFLMPLYGEPEVVGIATRRAPNDNETSAFQRLEAPTDIPFLPTQGLHHTTWQVIALPGEIEEDKDRSRRRNSDQDDMHVADRGSARDDTPGDGSLS